MIRMKGILLLVFTLLSCLLQAQDKQISGTVTSKENGEALLGVTVSIKGTTNGTITNLNGEYNLNVGAEDSVLVFSFIGLKKVEQPIGNTRVINVQMERDAVDVDEVVIVAYGAKKKSALTGSVSLVESDELQSRPVANFTQALQGRASGVRVTSASGRPGDGAYINIRGTSTLNGGTSPLVVIDGVISTAGAFSALNPNDIETINITKDAASSGLYGSRASNGVVIITTKKGKAGKTKINYSVMRGFETPAATNLDFMNTEQKLNYEIAIAQLNPDFDQSFRDTTTVAGRAEYDSLMNINFDWWDELFRTGNVVQHNLSVSGGNDKTTFYLGGQIYKQEGIIAISDFNKMNARINLDHKANKKIRVGVKTFLGYSESQQFRQRRNVQNPFYAPILFNTYETSKLDNGDWNLTHVGYNPFESMETNPEVQNTIRGQVSSYFTWDILPVLSFTTQMGVDFNETNSNYYNMPGSLLADITGTSSMTETLARVISPTFTHMLSYKNSWGPHRVSSTVGAEFQEYKYQSWSIQGENFPTGQLTTLSSAAVISDGSGTKSDWSMMSYINTNSYSFDDKYNVDVNLRWDGSSSFSEENRWGLFYSGGLSWNLHEESFMENVEVVNNLKLRASYGIMGNKSYGGNYAYRDLYGTAYYGESPAYVPSNISNPALTWEKNAMTTFGVDYALFTHRVKGSFEVYKRKVDGLFQSVPLSSTTGFSAYQANLGQLSGRGVEFSVSGDVVKTKDLTLTLFASISRDKTYIDDLESQDQVERGFTIAKEGEELDAYYLIRYAGVNPANGESLYYDADGELTNVYDEANDRVVLDKSPTPEFYGSFGLSASYKGFELSSMFYYTYGNYILSYLYYTGSSNGRSYKNNQLVSALDYWKEPGDIAKNPKPDPLAADDIATTRNLLDGSYIRLRDLTLSYTLPSTWTEKIKMERARVFVQGTNLFTLTNGYIGYDPEVGSNLDESGNYGQGVFDEANYPAIKAFNIGIDVTF